MQSTITGRHIEVTPALKNHVDTKLTRLGRHYHPPMSAQITLDVEKLDHKAEGLLKISGEKIYAEATQNDMYAAIDALADKLDRQLKRHKEQRAKRHATPISRLSAEELSGERRKRA